MSKKKRKKKGYGNAVWDRFLGENKPTEGTTHKAKDLLVKVRWVKP